MIGSKVLAFASGVAMLSSLSFAWSISGTVVSEAGEGIPEVNITTFNFGGFSTKTDALGNFVLSSDQSTAIKADIAKQMSVQYNGSILSLEGVNSQVLNVAVIDALGKVMYKKEYRNVYGNVSLDLSKVTSHRAAFLRVMANGKTYMYTAKGALMLEGDVLPMLNFAKDGFESQVYKMQADVESNVTITLKKAGTPATPTVSSSSGWNPGQNPFGPKSSSSVKADNPASSSQKAEEPASSSAKAEAAVVDCSGKTYQAGEHDMSVSVGGKNRTFIMRVPSAYKGDKPVPLLIDYHPIGGESRSHMNSSSYKTYTDPEGVISLYPQGTTKTMGPGWNVGPCCSNDDDLAFTTEMIKFANEKLCIDNKRIYAAGFSMGGGMSNHVACMMNDVFAAVAPAAMDLNKTNSAQCVKNRPISVIQFRGTADNVCRYQGGDSGFNDGLNFLGAEANFKFWADFDECSGSPSKNADGCDEYSNCKDGTKVVLCTKQGGGHEYGDGKVGWNFLKQFTLP